MRNMLTFSSLLLLSACLSESKFNEQFADKYCEEYADCNGGDCPVADGTTTGTGESTCDFDKKSAKECLSGEWGCNTDFPGFEFPVPPSSCDNVCGGGGTTGGGATGTGMTGTGMTGTGMTGGTM